MSSDPGDLANMADLALPEPISFWPPAAGVWIVGAMTVAMLAVASWRALQRYRADAYLRCAATEIDALSQSDGTIDEAVSAIIKRAAIIAYGREAVAALTGAAWANFITRTTPAGVQTAGLTARLECMFSPPEATAMTGDHALIAEAKAWLRGQRGQAEKGA